MKDILKWAEKRPLFTLNDLERVMDYDREYLRLKLHRMVEGDDLKRIERGKYTVYDDPMIYATYIETPSFFSYWTALRYYNLTTQEPTHLQVITNKNRSKLEKIEFYSTKNIFGYRKKDYRGFRIFMADKERLLLDCLNRDVVPPEELTELLRDLDKNKLMEYSRKFGNRSLYKRLGYLMEKFGNDMSELLTKIDHNYVPLDLTKPTEGEKNFKWKVVVNADVS